MIQKLADAIHQGTGCDDVVAYQTAKSLVEDGWVQVDRGAELPAKYSEGMSEIARNGYMLAQAEILKDGWVKEVKDGK